MARLPVSYTIFLAVAVLLSAYGACAEEFLLSSAVSNSIVLLDSVTGLERPFIKATGLLDHPDSMVFHPSTGRLLVSTGKTKATSKVLQFDARTGEYLGRFDDGTLSFPMYITPFYHISLSLAPSRPYERSTWGMLADSSRFDQNITLCELYDQAAPHSHKFASFSNRLHLSAFPRPVDATTRAHRAG